MPTEIDSEAATYAHAESIRNKAFVRSFYESQCRFFARQLAGVPPGCRLELGSGGSLLKSFVPELLTSDVVPLRGVDLVFSALNMPVRNAALSAIVLQNVFHHLEEPQHFLDEADRCLRPGGKLVMVEPANTPFARFIYQNFHPEPFDPDQPDWSLPHEYRTGRLSGANGAIAWIVFTRDRGQFENRFPRLAVTGLEFVSPFLYLLGGGVSRPQMLPGVLLPVIRAVETVTAPLNRFLGLFVRIVVEKKGAASPATRQRAV
jgi:SAM-dependent methyltransferase